MAEENRSATDSIHAENNTIVSVFGISIEVRAKTSGKALVSVLSKEGAKKLIAALVFAHELAGRDFFITLPDPERMKGKEHEEGSHELAEARVHTVGQIALPRGRKQIQAREVLS